MPHAFCSSVLTALFIVFFVFCVSLRAIFTFLRNCFPSVRRPLALILQLHATLTVGAVWLSVRHNGFSMRTFLFIYLFMPTFRHFLFIYYFATKSFGHFKQLHISYLYFFGFGYLNCHNNAFGHFFRRYDLTEVMCMLHFPLFVKPLLKCLRFLFNYANKQTLIFTTPNIIMGFQKGCIHV